MRLVIDNFQRKKYLYRLKALPSFLVDNQTEGNGTLQLYGGICEHITFAATFSEYCKKLDVDLWKVLKEYVSFSNESVKVVDIGCGIGNALKEVKDKYGSRVTVIGFELTKLSSHNVLDKLVPGNFEEKEVPQSLQGNIHLVVSDQVFRYFLDPFGKPYEKVKQMLKPEGKAFIDVFACELPKNIEQYNISVNHRLTIAKPKSTK